MGAVTENLTRSLRRYRVLAKESIESFSGEMGDIDCRPLMENYSN
jgi:hypothetical protein